MEQELNDLELKYKEEFASLKEKYKSLKKEVRTKYKKEKPKKPKRKAIPKKLKNMIWDKFIGKEKGVGNCYCCNENIDSKNFEAGHIVSVHNGGKTHIDNLKPVCGCCNKSMGTKNMEEFKKKFEPKRPVNWNDLDELCGIKQRPINNGFYNGYHSNYNLLHNNNEPTCEESAFLNGGSSFFNGRS
jgi:hypothetical protein